MLRADPVGVLLVGVAACTWGTWSLFVRFSGVPADVSAPVVFALMGVLTLPAVWRDRRDVRWDRGAIALLVANAVFAAGNIYTYFAAMAHTTVAVAALTHYLAPILVAVAAPVIERERVPGAPAAAVLGSAGLVLVLEPWAGDAGRGDVVLGAALGAASAVCYAGNIFIARRLEPRVGASRTIAYHALIAAAILAPVAGGELAAMDARAVGVLALGAAGPGALAGVLFVTGLARIGSSRAAVLAYLEPLVAVVAGWIAWGEGLRAPAAAGAALIVAAGLWVTRAPARAVAVSEAPASAPADSAP